MVALPLLSPDALSSAAYGPEAMLVILLLAGTAGLRLSLPIAAAIVVLMPSSRSPFRLRRAWRW